MAREFAQTEWDDQLIDDVRHLIRLALREDLNRQFDWTTVSLVPAGAKATAAVVTRRQGVAAGLEIVPLIVDEMESGLHCELKCSDGSRMQAGQTLATINGSARDLLTGERIILNFLGRLCGIATLVSHYVDAVQGTTAKVYDTRKTTPGYRRLEKYAVRCGGGTNHRVSLDAAVMIKDNHLAFCREEGRDFEITDAVCQVREFLQATIPDPQEMIIEVEVDTLQQLERVLPAQPDIVLMDNMSLDELTRAVAIRTQMMPGVQLEASGGVTLDTIGDIARTGVERISVGALTHSATNLDIGLDWL